MATTKSPYDAEETPAPKKTGKDYKATAEFSFGGTNFYKGDAVNVDEETAKVLIRRKQIAEGKGKDPEVKAEGISMKETVKDRLAGADVSDKVRKK